MALSGTAPKINLAWREFFSEEKSSEIAEWFSNWGYSSNNILSAMIHPSYAGGLFTAIPFKEKYGDDNWPGIWGDKSDGSVHTVYMYLSFIFPIFILNHEFPFKGFDEYMAGGSVKYEESNELHKHVKIGRNVLASMIFSLGKDTNQPHVFPEIDMSIWENYVPEVQDDDV